MPDVIEYKHNLLWIKTQFIIWYLFSIGSDLDTPSRAVTGITGPGSNITKLNTLHWVHIPETITAMREVVVRRGFCPRNNLCNK